MLPTSLLLSLLLYLPSTLANEISFTSHLQLELQDSNVPQFNPSPAHRLSRSPTRLRVKPTTVYRPRSLDVLHKTRLRSLQRGESESERVTWDRKVVQGPDVEDLHTLAQLARMAGNAYALPGQSNWYDVDYAWNTSFPFGWEDGEGFRGHVFLSSDNSTIVLSIKGTTLQGPTSKLDKFNDNLLFSCCCARVDFSWVFRTVCDCYANHWRCDSQCLTDALVQDSLFYSVGVKLVDDLLHIYPSANVWLVGHSLGGSLASLLGATYGLPAVAFEAPGERLAASRLHLPLPPPIMIPGPAPPSIPAPSAFPIPNPLANFEFNTQNLRALFRFPRGKSSAPPIPAPTPPAPPPPPPRPSHHPVATTHVYHTGDPIPQGACTGVGSPCAQAGYALETRCHLGQSIVFDTVKEMKWSVDVRHHVIKTIVKDVLEGGVWWGRVPDDDGDGKSGVGVDVGGVGGRKGKGKKGGGETSPPRTGKGNVPKPFIEQDCVDCHKWYFGDFKDRDLARKENGMEERR